MARKLARELDEESAKQARMQWWFWIFCLFIILFSVGTIVIIALALQDSGLVDSDIDVVLYSYQPPTQTTAQTTALTTSQKAAAVAREPRHVAQIHAVRKYMPWVKNIFVLRPSSTTTTTADIETNGATLVPFVGTDDEAFAYMPHIPTISNYAMFLGDYTFPLRTIKKSYLFTQGKRRMFNVFREQSEMEFFKDYLESSNTMPCLVTDLQLLKSSQSWTDMIFREITEEKVVLSNDMNRDMMISGRMPTNIETQLQLVSNSQPHFVTFHVNNNQASSEIQSAHSMVHQFLLESL